VIVLHILTSMMSAPFAVTILNMPTRVAVDVGYCFRCVCLIVCVTFAPKAVISRGETAKSLWLAAAYTSYGAAGKILRRLTAYGVYGILRRSLGALILLTTKLN